MTDYTITQTEKILSSNAIRLVKYENKVSRLVFSLDGTIPEELRLYAAFFNPTTKKHFYEPLLYDNEVPYITVGTEITYYPSKRWEMLLIGISPDTEIDQSNELDDSLIVWSSLPLKKLLVLDTFINDDAQMITHPNIEQAMDELAALHEDVVNYSVQIGEDATEAHQCLQNCQSILAEINRIYAEMLLLKTDLTQHYNSLMTSMQSTYSRYMADLRREREGG